MHKPGPNLVDTESITSKLSAIRAELMARCQDDALLWPGQHANAGRTLSELLSRAAVLMRLLNTFKPFSEQRAAQFQQHQKLIFEHMLGPMALPVCAVLESVTSRSFEIAASARTLLIERLMALDAMLPKTRSGTTDPDVLENLAEYLDRNRNRIEPVVMACELDMRLTRMAAAGYLNELTPLFYVSLLFLESGYPRISLPARELVKAALLQPQQYGDLLLAYGRHAVHSLATSLAMLIVAADEWPSHAGFYADLEIDLALASLRETLLTPPQVDGESSPNT